MNKLHFYLGIKKIHIQFTLMQLEILIVISLCCTKKDECTDTYVCLNMYALKTELLFFPVLRVLTSSDSINIQHVCSGL